MPDESKSLGQTYYEEVEALKTGGMKNADAVRAVAEKHGKKENAVRGGIHQYRSRTNNGSAPTRRRSRSSGTSVDDHLANARREVEEALALVDRDVEQAKTDLDAAQAHYDEVMAAVGDRKADLEQKLEALS